MALAGWAETAMFDLAVRIVITSAIGTAPQNSSPTVGRCFELVGRSWTKQPFPQ